MIVSGGYKWVYHHGGTVACSQITSGNLVLISAYVPSDTVNSNAKNLVSEISTEVIQWSQINSLTAPKVIKHNIIYRLQHLLILTHHYQHSLRGVKISTSDD